MKRKTLLCCMLVLVFCLSAVLLVACNKGISDEILGIISQNVYDKHKNDVQTAENYTLPAVSVYLDADDKEYTVNLKWEISGTTEVKIGELDGKFYPVTVPAVRSEDINYKLKVTLVDENQKAYADKEGKEYSHTFDRVVPKSTGSEQESSALEKATVKNPVAGTAYKWVTFFNYEYRYFGGEKGGSRLTTVDSFAASPDVFVENATGGGYYLYFMKDNVKTYINMDPYIGNDSGDTHSDNAYISTGVVLTTETANLIPYKIHESGALYVDAKKTCSHGVELSCSNMFAIRDKYPNEIASTVAVSYFTDNNKNHVIMVNECPMFLVTEELKVEQEDLTTQQILDRAFALGANEAMDGKWTLEGTVTAWAYSASYKNGDGKMTVLDKEITLFRLAGSEAANIAVGDKIRVKGILENHTDGAVNEVRFKSGASCEIIEKAPVVDDSILGQIKSAAVSSPVTTGSYKLVIWQGTLQKAIYATGAISSSNYLLTTEDISAAATLKIEEGTGGFYLVFVDGETQKYVTVTPNSSDAKKGVLSLTDTATSIFTVNDKGLLLTGDYVLGTYNNFDTISVSNVSYYTDSNIDNSQFIARIVPADIEITIPNGTIKAASTNENATVTFISPTAVDGVVTGEWYSEVKFTVAASEGYAVVSVKVNGDVIENVDDVYTVTLIGDMEIEVKVRDLNSKEQQIELNLADAKNTGIASSANTTVETRTINNVECTYYNCKQNSGSYGNYVMLCKADSSKGVTAGYFIGHVNGTIKRLTITINSNASDKTTYIVLFSASAFTGSETGDAVNLKKGTVTPFENSIENAGYFMIKIGNANNGQIVKIVIDYEPSDAPVPSTNEAKIGNTEYPTLEEAITAAKAAEGKTVITLLKDVTCGGIMFVSADAVNVEFDLNGHTLTVGKPLVGSPGTVSQSLHFEKGNIVVIKNGTIACENNSASMLLQNYCDLTLDGVTLDGSNLAASGTAYTLSNNCGTILIKGGSVIKARATNGVAFDLWYGMNKDGLYDNGVSVTVEAGCTINGKIEYGAAGRVTGTDWIEKTVLVLPEGEYTIEYTCNLVTDANANITIGGVKIGEVSGSEASNA